MDEEKNVDQENNTDQVQEYFTEEIRKKISEMSEEEMVRELLKLEKTKTWIAILKYVEARASTAQSAIVGGHPIKDPETMLRNQGILLGVYDLSNAVILLKNERENQEKAENEEQAEK